MRTKKHVSDNVSICLMTGFCGGSDHTSTYSYSIECNSFKQTLYEMDYVSFYN